MVVHWHCSRSSRNISTEDKERASEQAAGGVALDVYKGDARENATENGPRVGEGGSRRGPPLAAIPGIRFGIFLCVSRIVEIVPQAGH